MYPPPRNRSSQPDKIINQRIKEKENWSKELLEKPLNYRTNDEYETDGEKTKYSKTSEELKEFIQSFNQTNQFLIEPTYTVKALYALYTQLPFLQNKDVLFIHTGGVFFH